MSDYEQDAIGYAKLVVDLQNRVKEQAIQIKNLKGMVEIQNQMKVPVSVIKQVADQEQTIEKLRSDLKYYKKFLPHNVVEEREGKKKPSTRGSFSSSLKK